MKLIRKSVNDLREHPLNEKTRGITSEAMDRLKVSIDNLGTIQPIVWNEKLDCICSGHQRVKAYKSQGVEEVDVWVVSLNEHDHCLAMYMLNNHFGEFDADMLGNIVRQVSEAESLSVEAMGFDENKINNFLKDFETESLPQEKFCSTIIFDDKEQKDRFKELRKQYRDSAELSELATRKLKQWTQ